LEGTTLRSQNETNRNLLAWLNKSVKQEKTPLPRMKRLVAQGITCFGMSIGAASAYIMYVLNAEFGQDFCRYVGIDNPTDIIVIENMFGITAVMAMASLGALNVKDCLTALLKELMWPQDKPLTLFRNTCSSERIARRLLAAAAPFSAIPQSTLTWNHTSNTTLRLFVTPCAIITPSIFNGRGGQRLIDKIKPKSASVMTIENHLLSCKTAIENMSASHLETFLQLVFNQEDELSEDFFEVVFATSSYETTGARSAPEKIFSFIGMIFGLTAAIIFYQLTLDGTEEPLDINSVILRHLLSVFSYLLNAALSAIATQTLFERLYKMIFDDNTVFYSKTDKAFIAISLLIAPFAALPLGSLQIQNAQNGNVLQTLLIAPTFIGPMCACAHVLFMMRLAGHCLLPQKR
jgi:hypothetical protein